MDSNQNRTRWPRLGVDVNGEGPARGLLAWVAHSARVGGGLGLLLATADQVLLAVLCGPDKLGESVPYAWQRVAAIAVVGSIYATAAGLFGLLVGPWLRRRRLLASTIVASVLAAFFACHAIALAVRVLTDSYVTLGSIEFALACGGKVLLAALAGFAGLLAGLGLGTVAVGLVALRFLVKQRGSAPSPSRRHAICILAIVPVPSLVCLFAFCSEPMGVWFNTLGQVEPELAFISSLRSVTEGAYPTAAVERRTEASTRRRNWVGPPQTQGEIWESELPSATTASPNVLLLVLESVRTSHLGYLGYSRATTPNLDALAARSVQMRRTWATATHSNYAQPAILSSLFPRREHGLDVYKRLDYPRVLQHDVFHRVGYRTGTISSQNEDWQGMRRFQTTDTPTTFWDSRSYGGPQIETSSDQIVPDAVTVDTLVDWMERKAGTPWAVYVNLQSTHFPYRLPPGVKTPFGPTGPIRGPFQYFNYQPRDRAVIVNRYDNALHYVDEQIGRIRAYLERTGQLENTLWVITADHGELFGDRGVVTHGRTLREGELRVPLLLHWPARLQSQVVQQPVSHLDVLPTVLELVGVNPHPAFQGTSFAYLDYHRTLGRGIFFNIQGQRLAEGVLCWPWKLVFNRSLERTALYRLDEDPEGLVDRSAEHPQVRERLMKLLRQFVSAQLQFHRADDDAKMTHYAPRVPFCPELPGRPNASTKSDPPDTLWRQEQNLPPVKAVSRQQPRISRSDQGRTLVSGDQARAATDG